MTGIGRTQIQVIGLGKHKMKSFWKWEKIVIGFAVFVFIVYLVTAAMLRGTFSRPSFNPDTGIISKIGMEVYLGGAAFFFFSVLNILCHAIGYIKTMFKNRD